MDYSQITSSITTTIKQLGQPIKLIDAAGKTTKAYGVWGKIKSKEEKVAAIGNITKRTRELYVTTTKEAPVVGGIVIVNKVEYAINVVTIYSPLNSAIAYKIEVAA